MHIITVISVHRMLYHLKNLKNTRPLELSSNFKQHLILILKDKIEYNIEDFTFYVTSYRCGKMLSTLFVFILDRSCPLIQFL